MSDRWVDLSAVFPTRSRDLPWSWEDEEANTFTRQCLCCGTPGHYQHMLEAYIADHGVEEMGIVISQDGRLEDGHHRVVAARRLGITRLPTETSDDAQARWIRDHGYVDWEHRKFGDR